MTDEGRKPLPGELGLPQELHFGEEFSPFVSIDLPQRPTQEMLFTEGWDFQELAFESDMSQWLPKFSFTLEGIHGEFMLFGDKSKEQGDHLPLGEVRKEVSRITPVIDGRAGETEEVVERIPLGFAVQFRALSIDDIYKIQRSRLELKIGEYTYNIPLNEWLDRLNELVNDDMGDEEFTDLASDVSVTIASEGEYRLIEDSQRPSGAILLPYDRDALQAVRATFYNDVTPTFPQGETAE